MEGEDKKMKEFSDEANIDNPEETPLAESENEHEHEEGPTIPNNVPEDPLDLGRGAIPEEELVHPAVVKLLISQIDALKLEAKRLQDIKDLYHKSDKENGILKERLSLKKGQEVLYTAAMSIGSAMIGAAFSLSDDEKWLVGVFGILLLLGGIVNRFIKY